MNIEAVIPCRYVEVHDNLATIVGAGIDTFWLPQEPRVVQVMLAIRITAMAEELGEGNKHQMKSQIRDPDGNPMHGIEGEFAAASQGEPRQPDWLQGIWIPAGSRFEAPTEGTYTLTQVFGDSEHSIPLHVVHGLPPGVVPPPA